MSRYEIPARDPNLRVVVGWDNPLKTFFAQVIRPAPIYDDENDDEDEDESMLLWVGTEPCAVVTVDDLATHLAPFADLASDIVNQLRADGIAGRVQPLGPLQKTVFSVVNSKSRDGG